MNPAQHDSLQNLVTEYRCRILSDLDHNYAVLQRELDEWKASMRSYFDTRFAPVVEMLAGPYDKELEWEWCPADVHLTNPQEYLELRQVRLTRFPKFTISGQEFFSKYCHTALEVLPLLASAGFYTPPKSKFFIPFCKEVLEGSKSLLRMEDVQRLEVPEDQVDVAFCMCQELIATSKTLQRYCPLGLPMSSTDKSFYLTVVHSLVGLPYRVVPPLSPLELNTLHTLQTLPNIQVLTNTVAITPQLEALKAAMNSTETEDIQVNEYLKLLRNCEARVDRGE